MEGEGGIEDAIIILVQLGVCLLHFVPNVLVFLLQILEGSSGGGSGFSLQTCRGMDSLSVCHPRRPVPSLPPLPRPTLSPSLEGPELLKPTWEGPGTQSRTQLAP